MGVSDPWPQTTELLFVDPGGRFAICNIITIEAASSSLNKYKYVPGPVIRYISDLDLVSTPLCS